MTIERRLLSDDFRGVTIESNYREFTMERRSVKFMIQSLGTKLVPSFLGSLSLNNFFPGPIGGCVAGQKLFFTLRELSSTYQLYSCKGFHSNAYI